MDIRVIIMYNNTINDYFNDKVKKKRVNKKLRVYLYQIPCLDCNKCYIGETGRTLNNRIMKHYYAIKSMNVYNVIAKHWKTGHI